MIIFDLEALANDEHRRHFIDPKLNAEYCPFFMLAEPDLHTGSRCGYKHKETMQNFQPDYKAYNEACGGDKIIEPIDKILWDLCHSDSDIEIWSTRNNGDELQKTIKWMYHNISSLWSYQKRYNLKSNEFMKFRPTGDTTPQEVLFERWLDDYVNTPSYDNAKYKNPKDLRTCVKDYNIDFVFSSHKPTIEMFRRRGVFVFDCNQEKE